MKIAGIIAEYNPFHNGHYYHIQKAKELAGADYAIVVMSGDFVQRGTPAITDKFTRARMALESGADLVLELPVCYATASAELFAYAAVTLLDKLKAVDSIIFGSESGELKPLMNIADFLIDEPEEYRLLLKEYLAKGMNYPAARASALTKHCPQLDASCLTRPNQILGIEYCKAIKKRNSSLQPIVLKRTGDDYHAKRPASEYCSATAVRNLIHTNNRGIQLLDRYIPPNSLVYLQQAYNRSFPMYEDDFSLLLKHSLLLAGNQGAGQFLDISASLANRIYNNLDDFLSFSQFVNLIKTRELTYTRVCRGLLHILLNITRQEIEDAAGEDTILYARILGFRKTSSELLTSLSASTSIPLITKMAGVFKSLKGPGLAMLKKDIFAADLYRYTATHKFRQKLPNEFTHPLEIVSH